MLRNALAVGVSNFQKTSVTQVYGSTLLALRGGGWVSHFLRKKCYITLNGPSLQFLDVFHVA